MTSISTIEELNAGPLADEELQMVLSFDASVHIRRAIAPGQRQPGSWCIPRARRCCGWFLRGWRTTVMIATDDSVFVACRHCSCSACSGRSLNVVSLAGLAFAVGLVLDAAIIVQENIVRLRQGGMPTSAGNSREGPSQVVGALFASTITSIAIFLPILCS